MKYIFWDIDGTLLDFGKSEAYGIRKCFEKFGLGECSDEMLERYSKINRKYWLKLELGEITKQQVLTCRFADFFKSENIKFDRVDEFNDEYQLRLGDKAFFCDNASETVSSLKGRYKQYAVTNGTITAQQRKLSQSGLIYVFDGVFISDEIGYEKPSIDFFNAVQDKIGEFDKNEVMIIGDSLSSDMQGGNNAGILCCWYNPHKAERSIDVKIDFEINDISQILRILEAN